MGELIEKFKKRLSLKTHLHTPRAKGKRCYDVTLSRQEGSMMRHLANAHSRPVLPMLYTGCLFLAFAGPVIKQLSIG